MRGWVAVVGCWLPLWGVASPQLVDFAYGMGLTIEPQHAVQRVLLHDDLYRYAVRSDLGDLRVFNGAGEVVPHLLRPPQAEPFKPSALLQLPLFPLYPQTGGGHRTRLHFTTDTNGVVVVISQPQNGSGVGEGDYLVDLSQVEQRIESLSFTWAHSPQGFVHQLTIEQSDDLNRWTPLVTAAVLADLNYGGERLLRDQISLPSSHGRYLLLRWKGDEAVPLLRGVGAGLSATHEPMSRHWQQVDVSEFNADAGRGFLFQVAGQAPIDRVQLQLPEQNSLIQAVLESRHLEGGPWQQRFSGPLYRLHINGAELSSQTIEMSPNPDRYWRLLLRRDDGGLGQLPPALRVGWLPHELLFLARGEGNFSLAFGSSRIEGIEPSMSALLGQLKSAASGQWGEAEWQGARYPLSGDAALVVVKPLPWRQWLLWATLLGAVLGLALLVLRLIKQMQLKA